ncbi:hypothetical protein [Bartonella sp. AP60NXGY]|uniref:hypothetical protein n=1 Tax=Bartonella sp. AP60NXGY TaxID=3243499 RepID=UPI0035D09EFB
MSISFTLHKGARRYHYYICQFVGCCDSPLHNVVTEAPLSVVTVLGTLGGSLEAFVVLIGYNFYSHIHCVCDVQVSDFD